MDQLNDYTGLLIRTLCDSQPNYSTDGAYLYCQTEHNQQSVFQTGCFLHKNYLTSKIMILQTSAMSGFPGFSNWSNQLHTLGLTENEIVGIKIGRTSMIHTLIESEALIRFSKKNNYTSIIVVAPPFQQLRAFMTAVTVALREYPQLFIYSFPGVAMSWQDIVVHSQGTLETTRKNLIRHEFERIATYQNKGDLASFSEVLAYLDKRQ